MFHITRERIRQIETAALRKLRTPTRAVKLENFLELQREETPQQSHRSRTVVGPTTYYADAV